MLETFGFHIDDSLSQTNKLRSSVHIEALIINPDSREHCGSLAALETGTFRRSSEKKETQLASVVYITYY